MLPPKYWPNSKVLRSKRVTIPKLFEPPLRAVKRSGLSRALALLIEPFARTISKFETRSHPKPYLAPKYDIPPILRINIHLNTLFSRAVHAIPYRQ